MSDARQTLSDMYDQLEDLEILMKGHAEEIKAGKELELIKNSFLPYSNMYSLLTLILDKVERVEERLDNVKMHL